MKSYVWLNDKIVSHRDLDSLFCDEGFLYGQGLFETMRSYNGRVFLLDRHIRRLINSCPIVDIILPNKKLLKTAVLETIKSNELSSGYIRLNVWKKKNGAGVFVFVKNMSFCSQSDYQQGFSAIIIKDIRQNETSPLTRAKSLNYYFYILMSKRAKDCGVDEAIILNSKGNICEGARSNIFIIKNDKLYTPPINSGCLPGITRQVVIEIAKQLNIEFKEREIKPKELLASDEVFLTNSLIEIMPLTKIDGKFIGNRKKCANTKLILNRYRKLGRSGYQ